METVYKKKRGEKKPQGVQVRVLVMCMSLTWELFNQMEFIDVTGDMDTFYTSLDNEGAQAPKKMRKQTKTTEKDAKIELWKSLAASLTPQVQQVAPQQNTELI